MVSKKSKKKNLTMETDKVLGIKEAIFNWEWGRNSVPREGQNSLKMVLHFTRVYTVCKIHILGIPKQNKRLRDVMNFRVCATSSASSFHLLL